MTRKTQSRGECSFCGKDMAKGGLSRHLKSCSGRKEANAQAKGSKELNLYHVQIQDAYGGDYWLHLEVNGTTRLTVLDNYLRAIWLECCGHLSHFSIGNAWSGQELKNSTTIDKVFEQANSISHVYDYGSSSEQNVKLVEVRVGKPLNKKPITLMARNRIPKAECQICKKQATYLCIECIYENEKSGLLCDDHLEEHSCINYGHPLPIVNSPRLGMCGYSGPAEPPY